MLTNTSPDLALRERLKRSPGTKAPLARADGPGRRGRESLTRAIALLVIGVLLAGLLWFGLVPAVTSLRAQGVPLANSLDPGVVDAGVLALNVALLIAVAVVHWSRRGESSE